MLIKNLPLALAVVLIVSLTLVEARFSDRWHDSSVDAAEFGARFKNVPKDFGLWQGKDQDVEEDIRRSAGAVNYVSRNYTNINTGRSVRVWLIVGHARDVCRHTPNVCYPNSGFVQRSKTLKHHMSLPSEEEAVFYTAKFEKTDTTSRHTERVFWTWNHPDTGKWEAPDNQRRFYGNSRALYKLYFTTSVMKQEDTIDDSVAVEFADEMLPLINAALFPGDMAPGEISSAQTSEIEEDAPPEPEPQETEPFEESSEEKTIFDAVS